MTELFKNGKIDNEITNGDSYTRVASFRLENAEGKILDGKMRIGWDVDERTKRHDRRNCRAFDSLAPARSPLRASRLSRSVPLARFCETPTRWRLTQTPYSKFKARKSSRGSSKLQLPNDVTNLRRYRSRSTSIFHSRHARKSSVKENESEFSSSSMIAA